MPVVTLHLLGNKMWKEGVAWFFSNNICLRILHIKISTIDYGFLTSFQFSILKTPLKKTYYLSFLALDFLFFFFFCFVISLKNRFLNGFSLWNFHYAKKFKYIFREIVIWLKLSSPLSIYSSIPKILNEISKTELM